MAKRLLTDTCAAIKLLALGKKIFEAGVLGEGDLVFHQKIFQETRKWKPSTKKKYEEEFELLHKSGFRSDGTLRVEADEAAAQMVIVRATEEQLQISLSRADKEQLISVIVHADVALVTSDEPFEEVAVELGCEVHSAEHVLADAVRAKVVSIDEANQAVKKWEKNNEKFSDEGCRELRKLGVKTPK